MADVEDLIEYFSTLQRGYDKVEFTERLQDLKNLVDATPLAPDEFDKLFRIWLRLELPISKWMALGTCLIPIREVDSSTIGFTVRWLLSGLHGEISASRLGFLLSWLTVALDHNLVNLQELDKYYVVFHTLFTYDRYSNNVAKLLYTLTKPTDVTRSWTQFLLNMLLFRQNSRGKAQITALLSLYKSYRPECVPENIPSVSIHSAFPKINVGLLKRFARVRDYLDAVDVSCHLKWRTHLSERGVLGNGYKVRRLIPDMDFINIGSELYSENTSKNFLHFKDGVKVLTYSLVERAPRPAQLLSLLCNETGVVLLCVMPRDQHAFLSHELRHLLRACFIRPDPWHQYSEKADLLSRVAKLQETLQQPVPVVSRFLCEYLPTWDGFSYFEQILSLLEWVYPDSVSELCCRILRPLHLLYHSFPQLARLDVLRTMAALYNNMAFSRTREHQFFLNPTPRDEQLEMMGEVREFVQELCLQSLARYPGNSTVLASVLLVHEELNRCELAHGAPCCTLLPPRAAAPALLAAPPSLAALVLLQRKILARLYKRKQIDSDEPMKLLTGYKNDVLNTFIQGRGLVGREEGLIFSHLPENTVHSLLNNFPGIEDCMTIGKHIAMAPYTYTRCDSVDVKKVTNEQWLEEVIKPQFKDIGALLSRVRKTDV